MDTRLNRLWSLKVQDIMSPGVQALRFDQNMEEAASFFGEHHISGAPVVDADGKCIGVLSVFDIVCSAERRHDRVEVHMTSPAKTLEADSPILTAGRIMCDAHVHRIIVLDADNRPIATTTSLDVVSAMVNAMEESTALRSPDHV